MSRYRSPNFLFDLNGLEIKIPQTLLQRSRRKETQVLVHFDEERRKNTIQKATSQHAGEISKNKQRAKANQPTKIGLVACRDYSVGDVISLERNLEVDEATLSYFS